MAYLATKNVVGANSFQPVGTAAPEAAGFVAASAGAASAAPIAGIDIPACGFAAAVAGADSNEIDFRKSRKAGCCSFTTASSPLILKYHVMPPFSKTAAKMRFGDLLSETS